MHSQIVAFCTNYGFDSDVIVREGIYSTGGRGVDVEHFEMGSV